MAKLASAGTHLIIDGEVADPKVFTRTKIEGLFTQIIAALGMTALDKPQVYEVPVDPEVLRRVELTGNFEDEGGVTGIVVISTSHITCHCWPLQNFFSMDCFSCKDYNTELALSIIRETLGVTKANVNVQQRRKPL
jgi:S-adenosylmethionine/arginine decarboxylase-like enzyme